MYSCIVSFDLRKFQIFDVQYDLNSHSCPIVNGNPKHSLSHAIISQIACMGSKTFHTETATATANEGANSSD